MRTKKVIWSAAGEIGIVVVISALASRYASLGMLLAPGMLAGAIVFQEGIHSDYGNLYLILAGILDVCLYGTALYFIFSRLAKRAERNT